MEKDPEKLVALRAAEFLELTSQKDTRNNLLTLLKEAETPTEANLILNTIALLKDVKPGFKMTIPENTLAPEWMETKRSLVSRRISYINKKSNE